MTSMSVVNGFWEILGAMAGISLAVVAAFRTSMMVLLRQHNADLREAAKDQDRELAEFRQELAAVSTRYDETVKRLAIAENRVAEQAALLYDKQRYIGRLEKLCTQHQLKLPPRDRLGGDLKELE